MKITRKENDITFFLQIINTWWSNTYYYNYDFECNEVYQVSYILKNTKDIVLLSDMRGVGKTAIIHNTIKSLIKSGTEPKQILYIPVEHLTVFNLSIFDIIDCYIHNINSKNLYCFIDEPFLLKSIKTVNLKF